MNIEDYLRYEPETGKIFWLVSRGSVKVGEEAGCSHSDGYLRLILNGKEHLSHRMAWRIYHGYFPPEDKQIDHINGDRSDNRISNLRLVTKYQNCLNSKKRSDSSLEFKGVTLIRGGKGFRARITKDKKRIHLGVFPTAEMAHQAYVKAAKKLHGEFARW